MGTDVSAKFSSVAQVKSSHNSWLNPLSFLFFEQIYYALFQNKILKLIHKKRYFCFTHFTFFASENLSPLWLFKALFVHICLQIMVSFQAPIVLFNRILCRFWSFSITSFQSLYMLHWSFKNFSEVFSSFGTWIFTMR